MRKASLAEVKANLSKYVDQAQHYKRPTTIHRHGKPAAVIVPVGATAPQKKYMTDEEIEALWAAIDAADKGDPNFDAVGDLIKGRR